MAVAMEIAVASQGRHELNPHYSVFGGRLHSVFGDRLPICWLVP